MALAFFAPSALKTGLYQPDKMSQTHKLPQVESLMPLSKVKFDNPLI